MFGVDALAPATAYDLVIDSRMAPLHRDDRRRPGAGRSAPRAASRRLSQPPLR